MGPLATQHLGAEVMFYGLWMEDVGASFDDEPKPDAPFGSSTGGRVARGAQFIGQHQARRPRTHNDHVSVHAPAGNMTHARRRSLRR
jgi:hypothetical protein